MSKINVLSTGGTFEKVYNTGVGVKNFSFPEISAVEKIIKRLGIQDVVVTYRGELAKDSLEMTADDRELIADWCQNKGGFRCIIIHGTDTMIETACAIAKRNLGMTVILTGALQPACMRESDAEFNLGGALVLLDSQALAHGVYIVMNGGVWRWDMCKKNPITGRFENK
jgi:L-asparaginase